MRHPERIVPEEAPPGVVAQHLKRYEFALPWCDEREVLDAGCGVGYGSALLATRARRVVGVDLSSEAIQHARRSYPAQNVEFRRMDLQELELPDGSFDTVCAFETIEHLDDPERHLREVVRVLRPGGAYVVSTPRADQTTDSPENPFHRFELSPADFRALLGRHFDAVELYGQRRVDSAFQRLLRRLDVFGLRRRESLARAVARPLGIRTSADLTADDIVIEREDLAEASELIAVCRRSG